MASPLYLQSGEANPRVPKRQTCINTPTILVSRLPAVERACVVEERRSIPLCIFCVRLFLLFCCAHLKWKVPPVSSSYIHHHRTDLTAFTHSRPPPPSPRTTVCSLSALLPPPGRLKKNTPTRRTTKSRKLATNLGETDARTSSSTPQFFRKNKIFGLRQRGPRASARLRPSRFFSSFLHP